MAMFRPHGVSRKLVREVQDTRKPLYMVFVPDTSSSMNGTRTVTSEEGSTRTVRKIDELNEGLRRALTSLREFEAKNVMYKVYYQIIELNTYGKALFSDFVPLSADMERVDFAANGVTCLENSLSTLKTFLDPKHLPGCNRAVNVILMSDGQPTDVEGYAVPGTVYEKTIAAFKDYLCERQLDRHVDCYSIGVGADACESMLRSFADDGRYFSVEDLESLAEKLDMVTRCSIATVTTRPVSSSGVGGVGVPGYETPKMREIDAARCLGTSCRICMDACLLLAVHREENGLTRIRPDRCIGCGACDHVCPVDAISVVDGDFGGGIS